MHEKTNEESRLRYLKRAIERIIFLQTETSKKKKARSTSFMNIPAAVKDERVTNRTEGNEK